MNTHFDVEKQVQGALMALPGAATQWPRIAAAQKHTQNKREALRTEIQKLKIPFQDEGLSLVVYGSMARGEMTVNSDLDWSLLMAGPSNPEHLGMAQQIAEAIKKSEIDPPGATGTFGGLVSSHELIHKIGGEDDTNRNMTRRILLLLESCCPLEDRDNPDTAYNRALTGILHRYIGCDASFRLTKGEPTVPRFLLNDVVRLWRTMAVDYAKKRWDDPRGKWALRNAKLRLSRKLLFSKGLIMCLACEGYVNKTDSTATVAAHEGFLLKMAKQAPLDILAWAAQTYEMDPALRDKMFGSYDEFLGILDDKGKWDTLKELSSDQAYSDDTFKRVRVLGKEFQEGLETLLFDSATLKPLTRKYGLF